MSVSLSILEDSADVLLNVNMVEVEVELAAMNVELAAMNVELKKGVLGYNPYAEENVDDLGNVSGCGDHVVDHVM